MPIDARIPLGVTPPDPNGFVNALAAGRKVATDQRTLDLTERKNELANRLAVSKAQSDAELNTAKANKANAEGVSLNIKAIREGVDAIGANPTRENFLMVADWLDTQKVPTTILRKQIETTPDQALPSLHQGLATTVKEQETLANNTRNTNSQIADRGARLDETVRYHNTLDADRDAGRVETNRHNVVQESKKPGNGLSITGYDEQGRPLIQVGGSSAPFTKPTLGKLEETQVQGMEGLARLDEINRVADPELLTYGSKLKDWGLDLKSKIGFELSPEDQKFRTRYTEMRQATMVNLNKTIKDQTGATITDNEVPRIESTVPTMNDAPDQFPTKLKGAQRLLRNGMIRGQIAREAGMDPLQSGIDLGDTKTLIDKRGEQLTRHLTARSQGMAPADVQALVDKQLKAEFGL
jgi:hypothetical protein